MAFGPLFPELSATTLNELVDSYIYQNSYVGTPFQRYMRASGAYDPFGGGAGMQVPDLYQGVGGGALFPGEDITIMDEQVITASLFQPKAYAKYKLVNDFVIEAQNKGPEARVALLEAYLNQMTEGIDFQIEGDMFRHGQASGNGVNDNRLASINGISEALNDGVVPSWDGNVFPTYGGQTRNGAIGASLNSTPIWLGDQNGNPAPPELPDAAQDLLDADPERRRQAGRDLLPGLLVDHQRLPAPGAVLHARRQAHQLGGHQARKRDDLLRRHRSIERPEAFDCEPVLVSLRHGSFAGSDSDGPVHA